MISLTCAVTLLVNVSTISINQQDLRSFARAAKTCGSNKRYKESPCLKKFIKREQGTYWAICGEKQEYDTEQESFSKNLATILRL